MEDESTKLLREIRDLMTASAARDAAWHDEMRVNMKRGRTTVRFLLLPLLIAFVIMMAWSFLSAMNPAEPATNTAPPKVRAQ